MAVAKAVKPLSGAGPWLSPASERMELAALLDVVRACALGATAAFAGKAFLWGLGALGEDGPGHVIDLLIEETQGTLAQLGARTVDEVRSVTIRHPGALQF